MNKFWKSKVTISDDIYENSKVVMWILRLIGLFPLVVKTNKISGRYLQLSILYTLYSYAIGLFAICNSYYDQYIHLFSGNKPMHIVTNTDKFVRFGGINAYCTMIFCEVFVMPRKLIRFFEYLKDIECVDNTVHTKYKRSEKYVSILLLSFLCGESLFTDFLDIYMGYIVDKKNIVLKLLRTNVSYYMIFMLTIAVTFTNRHMAYSLRKRIIRINELLDSHLKIRVMPEIALEVPKVIKPKNIAFIQQRSSEELLQPTVSLTELNKMYLKLIDGAENLNVIFGINNLVAIFAALLQMVAAKYFMILVLQGKTKTILELTLWISISSIQILRIFLIIEPWYACLAEAENSKRLICKLLALKKIGSYYRQEVNTFAVTLCLRNFEFNACGLFSIDRSLYTALISNITTFVVISLQAQEHDTV